MKFSGVFDLCSVWAPVMMVIPTYSQSFRASSERNGFGDKTKVGTLEALFSKQMVKSTRNLNGLLFLHLPHQKKFIYSPSGI